MGPSKKEGLKPEQEREREDFESPQCDCSRGRVHVPRPSQLGSSRQRNRDTRQEEKQCGARAANENGDAEGGSVSIGKPRPAVEEMSVDHQQHGHTAQPIEVLAAPWLTVGSGTHADVGYRPSETENETSRSMS